MKIDVFDTQAMPKQIEIAAEVLKKDPIARY